MGRNREFDENEVLTAAVECFWERGYELTSLRDLSQHMGVTGTSIYNAFGNKRSLFLVVLDRYVQITSRDWIGRIDKKYQSKEAISIFFDDAIERSVTDPKRRGCLLVNSAIDIAPQDVEVRKRIDVHLEYIRQFFLRHILISQAESRTKSLKNPDDFSRTLLAVLLGLRTMSRLHAKRSALRGMVAPVLEQF